MNDFPLNSDFIINFFLLKLTHFCVCEWVCFNFQFTKNRKMRWLTLLKFIIVFAQFDTLYTWELRICYAYKYIILFVAPDSSLVRVINERKYHHHNKHWRNDWQKEDPDYLGDLEIWSRIIYLPRLRDPRFPFAF